MKIYIEKELFQWEKNRYVLLELEESEQALPTFAQFYNSRMSVSLDNPVVGNKIKIPSQLLEQGYPIMVVVCSGSLEDAHAISRKQFNVIKRAKPDTGYEPDGPSGDKDIIYDGGEEQ